MPSFMSFRSCCTQGFWAPLGRSLSDAEAGHSGSSTAAPHHEVIRHEPGHHDSIHDMVRNVSMKVIRRVDRASVELSNSVVQAELDAEKKCWECYE